MGRLLGFLFFKRFMGLFKNLARRLTDGGGLIELSEDMIGKFGRFGFFVWE